MEWGRKEKMSNGVSQCEWSEEVNGMECVRRGKKGDIYVTEAYGSAKRTTIIEYCDLHVHVECDRVMRQCVANQL